MNIPTKNLLKIIAILCSLVIVFHGLMRAPRAPDVTFVTTEGQKIHMNNLRGKVVLVNFWATDCPGCNDEMPALIDTYKSYKNKGLEVIAVAMPYDPPAQLVNYIAEKKLPFPVMHDGNAEMTSRFGNISATPTAFLFDKDGSQLQRIVGKLDFDQLHALLQEKLG